MVLFLQVTTRSVFVLILFHLFGLTLMRRQMVLGAWMLMAAILTCVPRPNSDVPLEIHCILEWDPEWSDYPDPFSVEFVKNALKADIDSLPIDSAQKSHLHYCRVRLFEQSLDETIRELQVAVDLNRHNWQARSAIARITVDQNAHEGLLLAQRILEENPRCVGAAVAAAYACILIGDKGRAAEYSEFAIKGEGNTAEAYHVRSMVKTSNG
ncbi:MAG: hypothetical protein U1D30_24655, partial [Planctomycetota bacterium]